MKGAKRLNITLNRTVDLAAPVLSEVLFAPLYRGERNAHTFVITATKDKAPFELLGSVTAVFSRADGISIRMEGEICGGSACVTLTPECYQKGAFELTVFLENGNEKTVIYAAAGRVSA